MTATDTDARRPRRDRARFWVRFACGGIFGSIVGFGFCAAKTVRVRP